MSALNPDFRLLQRVALAALLVLTLAAPGWAQSVAFKQAVAEAAARDGDLAEFYRANGYDQIWTGNDRAGRDRRKALLSAIEASADHGLPRSAYDARFLELNLRSVTSDRDLGKIEVALATLFLDYAQDVQSGILNPSSVDGDIARSAPRRSRAQILDAFVQSTPAAFLRKLPPQTQEYTRLMKQKIEMEALIARGGWGATVPGGKYEMGATGRGVVALRNRLIAMGFMRRSSSATFDKALQEGVMAFQKAHGLNSDGVAGAGTINAINVSATERLASIVVAMERERWLNIDRGRRHVYVNIADFRASIMDNGRVTFSTRTVVGQNVHDQRSPEFSDQMEYMVLNPSWYVPRSITVKEYLPMLQQDPYAVSHLDLINGNGNIVSRAGIDFTTFDADTFPFDLKEPPSQGNALGLVKFMFPNKFNIYLHDTPSKSLFARDRRAFSHGCIRLADPFDFAYAILSKQSSNPKATFHNLLSTGQESYLYLDQKVPVHLDYRTAFTDARGDIQFRDDVYGRDGKIFAALRRAGVAIEGLRS